MIPRFNIARRKDTKTRCSGRKWYVPHPGGYAIAIPGHHSRSQGSISRSHDLH
uniref:Uncharacterized protein n=1 Tax=Hyaloperonospora arabidopsidis (strain Emoy2) TaxID=559515 RepID=M4BFQ0_HYAAE